MKKLMIVLGIIFLPILILIIGFVSYAAIVGPSLDESSKNYVDEIIPKISSSWSVETFTQLASPELKQALNPDDAEKIMAMFSKLGALKHYSPSIGEAQIHLNLGSANAITANYTSTSEFENGPAKITIRLLKGDESWSILYFHVDSPIFIQ